MNQDPWILYIQEYLVDSNWLHTLVIMVKITILKVFLDLKI